MWFSRIAAIWMGMKRSCKIGIADLILRRRRHSPAPLQPWLNDFLGFVKNYCGLTKAVDLLTTTRANGEKETVVGKDRTQMLLSGQIPNPRPVTPETLLRTETLVTPLAPVTPELSKIVIIVIIKAHQNHHHRHIIVIIIDIFIK